MDERPGPSPEKLLRQFADWREGEEMPGRTMSYLKTGFLPEVLAGVDAETDGLEAMTSAWEKWENGDTDPAAVLDVLRDSGLEDLLAGLGAE
jgi:hypothetical protein